MDAVRHQNLSEAMGHESSFGPAFHSPGDSRFDFTLLFEQSILTIGPSALLLLASPLRIVQLLRQRRKVLRTWRDFCKVAACITLGALQLALLTQWARVHDGSPVRRLSIAASTFGLVDALALATLGYLEHSRSIKPSTIISSYLLLSIIFDAAQCRTLWLVGGVPTLAAVFTAMLSFKVVVFALEVHEKRSILLPSWKSLGPEATSGIVSKGVFWWLNDLLRRGFSASLSPSSLYGTDEELQSDFLLGKIQHQWTKRRGVGKHALFKSVLCSIKSALLQPVFPRLCLTGFKFAQPFLIKRIILYLEQHEDNGSKNVGYALIGAAGLTYTGYAIANGFYEHKLFRYMTMLRGALASLILDQTLELDAFASSGSATLTLVNADVAQITGAFQNFHEIWANVLEVGLAMYLLEMQLGIGAVGPAVLVIICTLLMGRLSKSMGPAMKSWSDAIQIRVSTTSDILGSIKETKMLGMVDTWIDAIQKFRIEELVRSKKFRLLITYMNVLGNTPSQLGPVLTFGLALVPSGHGVDARLSTSTAFVSISIMGLIVGPLARLLSAVPGFVSSLGCFERIEAFLDEAGNTRRGEGTTTPDSRSNSVNETGIELLTLQGREYDVIVAEQASFGIKEDEDMILRDINIRIPRHSLTVVAGKVGSGKTILLRGLLGELRTDGYLKSPSTGVGYCAQTTWLVNSTVRRNILGQSAMDDEWYNTVVTACALNRDFEQFPLGDLTLIGSKGLTLSGGQKQRVALARAIYSRNHVMVIDDVLSGLDWATRNHVWSQVFGPTGIFRRLGATVLLATHSLNLLADTENIVLLGDDGKIKSQGTLAYLQSHSHMSSLLSASGESSRSSSDLSQEAEDTKESIPASKSAVEEEEEVAAILNRSGETALYGYYLKSVGWRYGIIMVTTSCIATFLEVFRVVWLRFWTDANRDQASVSTGYYFGVYSMLSVVALTMLGVNIWFMFVQVIPRSAQRLHYILLELVMKAPLSFFTSTDTGDLINRFSKDMTLVDRELPTAIFTTTTNFLETLGNAALVLLGSSYFGAVVPVAILFLYGLQKFYLRTSRQLRFLDLQASAPLYSHILETVDGLATIRAFGWQSATREGSLKLLDDSQKPHYMLFCIQRWLTLVLDLFVAVSAVVLVTLGVTTPHATSPGAMALALTSLLSLSESLANLITSWTSLETSLGAISRLRELERDTPRETTPMDPEIPPVQWPSLGKLEIRDMKASYATNPDTAPALDGVSLSIRAGEKVAVCGRTGSGKSSLLLTMFRLLELDAGSVTVDGMDITRIAHDNLRGHLIAVPQEATLFPGTLRSNLFPAAVSSGLPTPDDEKMISAVEQVGLWNAISLRGGLDTDVANLALSHGQKQLLCLARAVLRKEASALLILDEAMSAVDDHTEDVMVRVIESEFARHTVISVVHRLNTVLKFDKIVVMEKGRVVEVGAPEVLMQREGGKFQALWNGGK